MFILGESVLYGGPERQFEPYYLLPVSWIHAEQLNHGINDNTFINVGFKWVPSPFRIEAEFMIDDFQIDHKLSMIRNPMKIGFSIMSEYGTSIFSKWLTTGLNTRLSQTGHIISLPIETVICRRVTHRIATW
jgi:hypothetical protein